MDSTRVDHCPHPTDDTEGSSSSTDSSARVVVPGRYSGSSIRKHLVSASACVRSTGFVLLTIPCTGDPPTGMSPRAQHCPRYVYRYGSRSSKAIDAWCNTFARGRTRRPLTDSAVMISPVRRLRNRLSVGHGGTTIQLSSHTGIPIGGCLLSGFKVAT